MPVGQIQAVQARGDITSLVVGGFAIGAAFSLFYSRLSQVWRGMSVAPVPTDNSKPLVAQLSPEHLERHNDLVREHQLAYEQAKRGFYLTKKEIADLPVSEKREYLKGLKVKEKEAKLLYHKLTGSVVDFRKTSDTSQLEYRPKKPSKMNAEEREILDAQRLHTRSIHHLENLAEKSGMKFRAIGDNQYVPTFDKKEEIFTYAGITPTGRACKLICNTKTREVVLTESYATSDEEKADIFSDGIAIGNFKLMPKYEECMPSPVMPDYLSINKENFMHLCLQYISGVPLRFDDVDDDHARCPLKPIEPKLPKDAPQA